MCKLYRSDEEKLIYKSTRKEGKPINALHEEAQ